MSRRRRMVTLALVALLGVAACGADGGAPLPPAGTGGSDEGEEADAVGLVGLWRVDREGGSDAEWLRLDAPELQLWADGSLLLGSWSAGGSRLVATVDGWVGSASREDGAWLDGVSGYRGAGDGWELLDGGGDVVATLRVDGAPEPIPDATAEWTEPPEVTDRAREELAVPAPLPGGLTVAGPVDLVGRWVADAPSSDEQPHVELADDGTYTGSDGCNGASGRWAVGDGGRFLATSGPMTAMACPGAAVPSWVATAARAGTDGGDLVLLDRAGQELGRLHRG